MDEDAGEEFDSGYMGPQNTFSIMFEERVEFEYFRELHPEMVGTVEGN
jgi:plastocyanin